MKQKWIGIFLMIFGIVLYNIYGKEITTKGFKRPDGTYFTHRVVGAILVIIGLIISIRSLIVNKENEPAV